MPSLRSPSFSLVCSYFLPRFLDVVVLIFVCPIFHFVSFLCLTVVSLFRFIPESLFRLSVLVLVSLQMCAVCSVKRNVCFRSICRAAHFSVRLWSISYLSILGIVFRRQCGKNSHILLKRHSSTDVRHGAAAYLFMEDAKLEQF